MVVPGAISFAKYHLLHHRHLGELDFDCGIPGPIEARSVARSSWLKAAWVAGYAVVQGVRPARLKKVRLLDAWTAANMVVEVAAMAMLVYATGGGPIKYLLASTVFAIGLHPLGGRWIQEHFALAPDQETYWYYGPLNKVAFNAGYHVEHHDLITVPWSRLPEIRRAAPEFYDGLQFVPVVDRPAGAVRARSSSQPLQLHRQAEPRRAREQRHRLTTTPTYTPFHRHRRGVRLSQVEDVDEAIAGLRADGVRWVGVAAMSNVAATRVERSARRSADRRCSGP